METDYKQLKQKMQERLARKIKSHGLNATEDDIIDEIEDAIEAVNLRRQFEATPEKPFEEKYSRLIVLLAFHAITKYGAEGETSHSENGIARSYDSSTYPQSLLNAIVPLANSRGDLSKL